MTIRDGKLIFFSAWSSGFYKKKKEQKRNELAKYREGIWYSIAPSGITSILIQAQISHAVVLGASIKPTHHKS